MARKVTVKKMTRMPQRTVPSNPARNPRVAKTGQGPFKPVRPYK